MESCFICTWAIHSGAQINAFEQLSTPYELRYTSYMITHAHAHAHAIAKLKVLSLSTTERTLVHDLSAQRVVPVPTTAAATLAGLGGGLLPRLMPSFKPTLRRRRTQGQPAVSSLHLEDSARMTPRQHQQQVIGLRWKVCGRHRQRATGNTNTNTTGSPRV